MDLLAATLLSNHEADVFVGLRTMTHLRSDLFAAALRFNCKVSVFR
jgi:hypothetical protein